MRLQFSHLKNKIWLALGLAFVGLLGVDAIWGRHGLLYLRYLEGQQSQLEDQLFQRQRENEQLRRHIERLESDDTYLEQFARSRLGLIAPGEILVEFATPTPTAVSNP